jgi:hypothetical protein
MYDAAVTLQPSGALCFKPNPTASKYGDVPGRCSNGSNLYPCECSSAWIGACCDEKKDGRARAGVASKRAAYMVLDEQGGLKTENIARDQLPEV